GDERLDSAAKGVAEVDPFVLVLIVPSDSGAENGQERQRAGARIVIVMARVGDAEIPHASVGVFHDRPGAVRILMAGQIEAGVANRRGERPARRAGSPRRRWRLRSGW